MAERPAPSVSEHFATRTDPRVDRCKVHRLVDIVTITWCGVRCGAEDWVASEAFGHPKGFGPVVVSDDDTRVPHAHLPPGPGQPPRRTAIEGEPRSFGRVCDASARTPRRSNARYALAVSGDGRGAQLLDEPGQRRLARRQPSLGV
jgi:hypothetical protein